MEGAMDKYLEMLQSLVFMCLVDTNEEQANEWGIETDISKLLECLDNLRNTLEARKFYFFAGMCCEAALGRSLEVSENEMNEYVGAIGQFTDFINIGD